MDATVDVFMFVPRYDVTVGPSCHSATDKILDASGKCVCDFSTEEQDTGFGCRARIAPGPSQAAQRRNVMARLVSLNAASLDAKISLRTAQVDRRFYSFSTLS
jgi:hypothetical protein